MPLIDPLALDEVLTPALKPTANKKQLQELLEDYDLSPAHVLTSLKNLMEYADSSSVKLAATRVAAEMNKMITDDNSKVIPQVTIIINDSEHTVNPITIPRGLQ